MGVATGEINVCEGTTTGWTLTTMTHAAFQASVGDDNAQSGVNPNLLPGGKYDRDVDAITGKELDQIQLDCDCTEIGYNDTPDQEVTNTWNSWGTPTAFDTTDGIIGVVPTAPTDYGSGTGEGTQIFHGYTVSDLIGNVGSCTLPVLYDITPPDCTDFSAQPAYIPADGPAPNNYNYSEVVTFSEPNAADPLLADGSAPSGIDTTYGIVLFPPRVSGQNWYLGLNTSEEIYSEYTLYDLAGNRGTCDWRLTLVGSICRWNLDQGNDAPNHPYCDDEEPELVAGTCPLSASYNCDNDNSGCGCGSFTAPSFTDDKGAVNLDITATLNGVDVVDVANLPNQQLSLGANNIVYTAEDVHGQTATCSFTITYTDTTGPLVYVDGSSTDGCPDDIVQGEGTQLCVTSGTTYDSYSVSWIADDECVLDTKTYTTQTVDTSDGGLTQLTANALHAFSFTAYDASNNPTPCTWNVYVADCAPPEITCEGPYNARIQQGSTTAVVNFVATGTDSSGVEPTVVFTLSDGTEIDTDYAFSEGLSQTVTATATDDAGLTDTCDIEVNIYEAYPEGTFEAALIGAIISQNSNPNGENDGNTAGDFNAQIDFITVTNEYHSVDALTGAPDGNDDNADIDAGSLTAIAANCGLTDPVCREDWRFTTSFTECEAYKRYDLIGWVTCDAPAGQSFTGESACEEANTPFEFSITLKASNYCWQELAAITFDDTFVTVSAAEYTTWLSGATQEYSNVPAEQTTFGHQDDIVGIIAVNSADVQTKTVTLVSAEKTHYSDSSYTILADSSNGDWTAYDLTSNEDTTNTGSDWVAFQYTESSVPLETTHYIRYTATVELDYFLGQRRRRSLLQVDTEDVREQTTSVDAAIFAQSSTDSTSVSTTNSSPDAIVIMMLQNCAASTPELEAAVASAIATYLRILQDRVSVSIAPITVGCLVTVSVSQVSCDSITITELLQELEEATRDPFNELHGYIYSEQDIPSDMTIDSSVFFMQQQPQTLLTSENAALYNQETSNSGFEWYIYLGAGVVLGVFVFFLIRYYKNESSEDEKSSQDQRRHSVKKIAQLLSSA